MNTSIINEVFCLNVENLKSIGKPEVDEKQKYLSLEAVAMED